jgi:lysophospholipase L1-like esterase
MPVVSMRRGHKIYCRALRIVARLWSETSQLLFIGDSLTTGCYPWFLARRIRERGVSVGTRIIAKSGATTRDAYDLLRKRLQHSERTATAHPHKEEVGVVVLLGGNDLKRGYGFQRLEFEQVFRTMLGFLNERFPHACHCVGTYPLPGSHPHLRPTSAQLVLSELNPAIRKAAAETGFHLCELENIFDTSDDLRSDGVHPTVLGERRMAEIWFQTIFPLLEASLGTDSDTSI